MSEVCVLYVGVFDECWTRIFNWSRLEIDWDMENQDIRKVEIKKWMWDVRSREIQRLEDSNMEKFRIWGIDGEVCGAGSSMWVIVHHFLSLVYICQQKKPVPTRLNLILAYLEFSLLYVDCRCACCFLDTYWCHTLIPRMLLLSLDYN